MNINNVIFNIFWCLNINHIIFKCFEVIRCLETSKCLLVVSNLASHHFILFFFAIRYLFSYLLLINWSFFLIRNLESNVFLNWCFFVIRHLHINGFTS